jgi:hypothetical protein
MHSSVCQILAGGGCQVANHGLMPPRGSVLPHELRLQQKRSMLSSRCALQRLNIAWPLIRIEVTGDLTDVHITASANSGCCRQLDSGKCATPSAAAAAAMRTALISSAAHLQQTNSKSCKDALNAPGAPRMLCSSPVTRTAHCFPLSNHPPSLSTKGTCTGNR